MPGRGRWCGWSPRSEHNRVFSRDGLTIALTDGSTSHAVRHQVTTHAEIVLVSLGSKLADEGITTLAQLCPNLTKLNLRCCDLTDSGVAAVARPSLKILSVAGCSNLTNAAIVAVAHGCPNLIRLIVGQCTRITDAAIAAVAHGCPNLEELDVVGCELAALPNEIGKLSRLRLLNASCNKLRELPRSIVHLDASCDFVIYENPLRTPPLAIARQGIPPSVMVDSQVFVCAREGASTVDWVALPSPSGRDRRQTAHG